MFALMYEGLLGVMEWASVYDLLCDAVYRYSALIEAGQEGYWKRGRRAIGRRYEGRRGGSGGS